MIGARCPSLGNYFVVGAKVLDNFFVDGVGLLDLSHGVKSSGDGGLVIANLVRFKFTSPSAELDLVLGVGLLGILVPLPGAFNVVRGA